MENIGLASFSCCGYFQGRMFKSISEAICLFLQYELSY